MDSAQHNRIANFIWGIADDILRDVYVRGKYRDIILPMTVIRRLDVLLESTKEEVLKTKKELDKNGIVNQDQALRQISRQSFYNKSEFTLKSLLSSPKQLKANFKAYLDGYSPNVQEIIDKFKFRNQLDTLDEADVLGDLIEKFIDPSINLSHNPVLDGKGNVKLPPLDNHGMGSVFEELIRRFNEENNEEAGEHFTPRDVIHLMTSLVFLPIKDQIKSGTYLVYDGACGTGGMLTESENQLKKLADECGVELGIHLYGQEVNPETYAICKADLLIKDEEEENIAYGSTLSNDAFPSLEFDFMIENPPYGKSWKTDLNRLCGGNKKDMTDQRFIIEHNGDSEYSLVPRSSDGQLLFMVNMLSKMKHKTPLGSRIATIHNGSSLFTGDAGQGESNIRRWIIENDWVEAIIALPLNMFYNTGIATYIWILTNRKAEHRKGKIQLIDTTKWFRKLRKNLGAKNCEFSSSDIKRICDTYIAFEETEESKIFPNEEFGYWKITVERPLRLSVDLSEENRDKFREACEEIKAIDIADVIDTLFEKLGVGPHDDYNIFQTVLKAECIVQGVKLVGKKKKLVENVLANKNEEAKPVIKNKHQEGRIEYQPDSDLRDNEQVPLLETGGIEAYFEREVISYVSDAWIDESKTKKGYEVPFTRYFYKYQPLRPIEEIAADIKKIEEETDGLMDEILGDIGGYK